MYCAVLPVRSPAGLLVGILCAVLLTSVSTMNAAPLADPSWRMMEVQSAVLGVKSSAGMSAAILISALNGLMILEGKNHAAVPLTKSLAEQLAVVKI